MFNNKKIIMKRILFVLGVLGVMGLASSFKSSKGIEDSVDDGGCSGGQRVCCASPGQSHI